MRSMKKLVEKYGFLWKSLLFVFVALMIYLLGDFPRRNALKETISLLTIISFILMINQFYLTRGFRFIDGKGRMSDIVRMHKLIGYLSVSILLIHPFLVVLPRQFEGGVKPITAFWEIISTYNNPAVLLGICGWAAILTMAVTSAYRRKLFKNYIKWRTFHGVLAIVSLTILGYHVLLLGRHSNLVMKALYLVLMAGGYVTIVRTYISDIRRGDKWRIRDSKSVEDSSLP